MYIHNNSDKTIEKWNFKDGFIKSSPTLGNNYDNSELAIAENYIGGVGVKIPENEREAFKIPKTLDINKEILELNEITRPFYISSIDGDFLFSGLDISDQVVFGRYGTDGIIKWPQAQTINGNVYSDCIIGAYPF